jgi:hypothetical protein
VAVGLIHETAGSTEFWFDFDGQFIDIDAGSDVLYVTDLWVAIKAAQWTPNALEYGQIATGGGLDGLGEVDGDQIESYLTVSLLEDWELRSRKTSGKFTVTGGNLIKSNGLDPFVDNPMITHFLFLSQAGTVARVSVGSAVTPTDKSDIATLTRNAILSDSTPFAGANIDAKISESGGGSGGLTVEQAEELTRIDGHVDVDVSSRAVAGEGLTAQQATWLDRIATLVGVPGRPEYVNTSSGTIGTGGTLTTLTQIGATLWKTVVTRHAGTAAEQATVTPEDVP